tara:strand:+ start:1201 stop:1917 length:717 start_codon:yes stop_codon:yes gene_type:complete
MNARGMPDVSLSKETEERIKAEDDKQKEQSTEDPFSRPEKNMKLEIKPTEQLEPIAEQPEEVVAPPIKTKPKRKATKKQLEALAKGRETSMKNRKERAKQKKAVAPKQHIDTADTFRETIKEETNRYMPQPQQAPTIINSPSIDYDRIINGVANIYQQQSTFQQNKEKEVEFNVKEFENKVREEERLKVLGELERIQHEEQVVKETKTATSVLGRQPQSVNPFAYAFNMNSRQRYKRY